jgi:hypothetical protein
VWQALRSGTAATSESVVRPMMSVLCMLESFLGVRLDPRFTLPHGFQDLAGVAAAPSPSRWRWLISQVLLALSTATAIHLLVRNPIRHSVAIMSAPSPFALI